MDNKQVMIAVISGVVLLAAVAMFIGFKVSSGVLEEDKGNNVTFQELKKGYYSNIEEKDTRIVKNAQGWATLWAEMFPTEMIASAVDFEENMLIAVFQGQKNSGGYDVRITKITETDNTIEVYVTETSPAQDCITTQALTSPYHIVEVKKSGKEVRFNYEQKVENC